jgi:anaerobic magnesium-protoporphyrin IX monomethyl ester cyclase
MRVLLIRPSSSQGELTKTSLAQHPINILYLAAYVRKFGHNVKVFDYEVDNFDIEKIREYRPNIVGITAMTPTIKKAANIARKIKKKIKTTILVGGNHVTALPKETLKEFPSFDIGIVGEGEETLKEICENKPLKKIKGITYRRGKRIMVNKRRPPIENLDELPFPARDLIDMKKYRGASTPGLSREFLNITELYINRGCNWGLCTFCASMLTHCKFRERSIDNVIAEMKECIKKYGINHFTIDDDTLTTSKKRTLEFCKKVKRLNVTWDCDSRVTVDKKMLKVMKESGCKKIAFGVESGSQKILQLIKKGITINQIKNAFKWCKEVGIETSAFFMIGSHPDETWEDLEMTKKLIKEIKPDYITASIAVPYPGTELRKQMEERNLVFSNDWSTYALYNIKPPWRTSNFTSKQLLEIQKKMVKEFYMKPSYIIKRVLKIHSLGELKYWVKAFFGVRKTIFKNKKK